ncbi:adenylate kinase [Pseudomonas sp. MAFF212428]|uniref:Adenylate kinase n=1 Tax=Pseudomonas brassicae TaxID=2708063 RepID=A0A6B3NHP3_9PSED|nr:adenylate kinase [Pseudomonas brassicae]NER62775.1 adenylate kinase [Pseudomonas brassicae]
MRIYITGASCAGVTTLGHALVPLLGLHQVDVDDFYWLPTNPPFSVKRPPEERVCMIEQALGDDDWVLSGSCNGWGEALIAKADLIVFVETPTAVRLERLAAREKGRFGDRIAPGGDMHDIHVAFRAWASEYDNPAFGGRNRARHEVWISEQTVPLTRIDGTRSTDEMAADVVDALSRLLPMTNGRLPTTGIRTDA